MAALYVCSDIRGAGTDAGVYIELVGELDGKVMQVGCRMQQQLTAGIASLKLAKRLHRVLLCTAVACMHDTLLLLMQPLQVQHLAGADNAS